MAAKEKLRKVSVNKLIAVVAVLVVLFIGYRLIATRAAGSFVSVEPQATTLAGSAKLVDDPTVSGKAILFDKAIVTPPPPPPSGGKPTAANTGVPAGTSLTVVNGLQIFATDNQVVSGLDIHGSVEIRAKNVTFKNSIVRATQLPYCGTDNPKTAAAIWVREDYRASATIQDVEVFPTNINTCLDGVWAFSTTLQRVHIHNVTDGIKAHDNTTIRDSYIHDLAYAATDPIQGPPGPNNDGTHNDAVQTYDGDQNIYIIHNNFALNSHDNATYQVTQDYLKVATNLHIEDNWLDGGGCTLNFAHKKRTDTMTGIYVVNNRFGRNSGFKDCPILLSTKTVLSQNSGNVWDDTGKPIPAPQVHD